uniref:Uncharacterized protein n=1 Tax=Plectus sambesii TaxID=2011161 RepID=A0A914XJ84_9BILA
MDAPFGAAIVGHESRLEPRVGGHMAANKDDTDRLASLQSLCSEKDQLIQSLSTDLQVEKHLREHESRLVGQKAARIKQWVVQRLKELEAQNEQLRKQNVTCTAQLQVLKSCAERTKSWRNSLLLSRSVTGALPVDRRDVDMDCNRTSEDSGLTSGDNADSSVAGGGASPPPDSERLLCCSTNSLRTNKHVYATCLPLRERNKAKMLLEMNANGGGAQSPRSRCGKMSAKLTDRTTSLPRDNHLHAGVASSSSSADSSPSDEKPIPTPRKSKVAVGGTVTRAYLLEPDILTIERDSLEPDGEFEDDDDDEIFDEPDTAAAVPARSLLDITESMCNLVVDPRGSSLTNDDAEYVNLAEIYTLHRRQLPGPPPAPPVHRSMAPWEEKLHALADKCLERRSDDGRDSLLSPRNSHERSSTRTTSSEGP